MTNHIVPNNQRGFDPFFGLNTVDQLFDNFLSEGPFPARVYADTRSRHGWTPRVDITEKKGEVTIYASLAGVRKEDVQLEIKDKSLVLRGEKKQEELKEGKWLKRDILSGQFYCAFSLPSDINTEGIKAQFKDGMLEVHLPKQQSAKNREVEINKA